MQLRTVLRIFLAMQADAACDAGLRTSEVAFQKKNLRCACCCCYCIVPTTITTTLIDRGKAALLFVCLFVCLCCVNNPPNVKSTTNNLCDVRERDKKNDVGSSCNSVAGVFKCCRLPQNCGEAPRLFRVMTLCFCLDFSKCQGNVAICPR